MNSGGMDLQIGDPMQLEFVLEGSRLRYTVRTIGMLPGGSVLVTAPERNGKMVAVREGQAVIARCFARDNAQAFPTRVLRTCVHPYGYLHLAYPEQRENVVVRHSRRATVALAAQARVLPDGALADATLTDLSIAGAMVEAASALGKAGDTLELRFKLPIEALGDRGITLRGAVRSEHVDEAGRYLYGVQFAPLEPLADLTLRAYVFGLLLNGPAQ